MKKNNVFCPLPWYSVTGQKNGKIGVCCINPLTKEGEEFGDIKKGKISDMWNSEGIKKLRRDLLQGKKNKYCDGCYKKEEKGIVSLRQKSLEYQKDLIPDIYKNTGDDGAYSGKIQKLDIRFSNLCNLACRMCSSSSSSLRIPLEKKLGYSYIESYSKEPYDSKNFWDDKDFFYDLEQIDIAGGEPLINKNFYKLLEKLKQYKVHENIMIRVMTNATILPGIYKGDHYLPEGYNNIFEVLEEFRKYNFSLSIDGYGDSYERIRIGSDWSLVKKNMDCIYQNTLNSKKATIDIMPTIQIDNIYDFPKLYIYARKRGIPIDIKPLFRPEFLCITNLSQKQKNTISLLYRALIEKNKGSISIIEDDFEYIIQYMNQKKADTGLQKEYLDKSLIMDEFQSSLGTTV